MISFAPVSLACGVDLGDLRTCIFPRPLVPPAFKLEHLDVEGGADAEEGQLMGDDKKDITKEERKDFTEKITS